MAAERRFQQHGVDAVLGEAECGRHARESAADAATEQVVSSVSDDRRSVGESTHPVNVV
ncbi:hypothetical protein Amsp01_043730 [Amycolatopsis sp. NBRC 101858]|nr:hypothetical protein Amsp01_043730 [Amycolatopsis sp. NBRC 101858]